MDDIINLISSYVWSYALIGLCALTGIYFSIRTGFLQIVYIKDMVRLLFSGEKSDKGITPFQAFSLAISGRVGTGNIVGVATAIAMGGPGAIFWMWLIAFLGSASAFIESALGQVYKQEIDGEYRGGPSYYIEKGLGIKWYAVLFAIITIMSCGLLLPGVQSNSISSALNNAFDIPIYNFVGIPINIVGFVIIGLLALIIFGGVKRLGQASEFIVPFMAGAYILMAIIIIGMNIHQVPSVLRLIFSSAFNQESLYSGVFGSAIAWGIKRGIYSNEAGQGTAPHAAAAASKPSCTTRFGTSFFCLHRYIICVYCNCFYDFIYRKIQCESPRKSGKFHYSKSSWSRLYRFYASSCFKSFSFIRK